MSILRNVILISLLTSNLRGLIALLLLPFALVALVTLPADILILSALAYLALKIIF